MVDHRPGDERREHQHPGLGEVEDPRRAPDQHERQRDRGVDRAVGDAVEGEVDEAVHLRTPGRRGGAASSAASASGSSAATTRPSASTIAAVGDRQRAARVLLDEQRRSGRCRSRRSRSRPHDLRGDARREPERGLVEQQQPRPRHQRAADRRASGARRRTACWPAARRRSAQPREELVDVGQAVAAAAARHSPPSRRFSSTVSSAITPRPSGTWAMPRRTIASTRRWPMSRPSSRRARRGRGRARRSCAAASSCRRRWRRGPR